jgi:DNA polymerase-3 subunit gamma/tau
MATTELHKLPETILSRCQQFEFKQIPTDKIFRRLREIAALENVEISDAALLEIARAGAGSLRDAQSAFDQVIAFSGEQITDADVTAALGLVGAATLGKLAETIAKQDIPAVLSLVEEIFSRGYDLRNFTRELMAYLRHLLVVKSGVVNNEILGVADIEISRLKELSRLFSEEDLVRCFHLLAETEKEVKDSPHPRFQLEIGLVKLAHAARLRTLDELIKRLETLESQLAGGSGGENIDPGLSTSKPAQAPNAETKRSSEYHQPPDFDPFDQTEPVDMPDLEAISYSQEQPRPSAAAVQAQPGGSPIAQGREVEAILKELQRLNRGLVYTALEDAQKVEYRDGKLIAVFGAEDMFARRLRESGALFREIGERLFGRPLTVEVGIGGQMEERVDEAELQRSRLRERAMQNPAVKLILEQTRGEIVWVKESER